jgi:plastocyanin
MDWKKACYITLAVAIILLTFLIVQGLTLHARQGALAKDDYIRFMPPVKGQQWVNNTPLHGAVLAGMPINVVVDFYYDRGPGSSISIIKDGKDYGIGNTTIDENKVAIRRDMDPAAPDGVYTVKYASCLPNGSCDNGMFQFAIDRSKAASFTDLRGQKDVTITMKDIAFHPKDAIISKGTKVTWVNEDDVIHYVNTDPHPEHSYYRPMNSEALKKGDKFAMTFNRPGIYPYHCSAHTNMTATLLVE